MTPQEKVDSCIKVAEFWSARYTARQEIEWKVTLGLWALLAAAAVFLIDKRVPYAGFWGIVVIVSHALWLRGIWAANQDNRLPAYHWARQAEGILRDANHKIAAAPSVLKGVDRWKVWDWSMAFQLCTTALLVALVYPSGFETPGTAA